MVGPPNSGVVWPGRRNIRRDGNDQIKKLQNEEGISEDNIKIELENIQDLTNLCIKHLEEINFFKPKEKKPKMLENLRSIFYKMDLSEKETRILSSVFASLAKKR